VTLSEADLVSCREAEIVDRLNGITSYRLDLAEPDDGGLVVRAAKLERAQPPRWAWERRIVLAYLNLLLGNEGIGKGTLIAWLIAKWTLGRVPGDLRGQPINVGVLGDEDSFDDVWTPRLHAAGADLARVVQIERPDGGFVNIKEDRERLARVVKERSLSVLYLDQLLDNLGTGTDDWRQKPVRDALQPLRSLARTLDIAAIGCLHPNKRAESFRQLVAGAPAFNSVSRSSLLLAQHPENETLRVLVRGKGNLSQTPAAVEFRIGEHRFEANGHKFKVPLAQDFSIGDLTVEDLVGNEGGTTNEHSKVADAAEIIEALLPRDGEWHPAKAIREACAENEIDERTAQRAKNRLRIEHRRTSTFPAAVEWRWPSAAADATSAESLASVGTVASANGRDPLRGSSDDTPDTPDGATTSRQWVGTAAELADDELLAIFPGSTFEAGAGAAAGLAR
jgi:AAA domain